MAENDDPAAAPPSKSARLTIGSIRGHLWTQTAPMIVGIAAIMSIGIIDAYYIGQLGAAELAAVSFIFPVTQALSSLGVGIMVGIASVVSRALGRGNEDYARGLANLGVILAAGVGIVLAAVLWAIKGSLFTLMQAEPELLPLIDAYMLPYAIGFAALPAMMGINGALRAQGAAKRSMAILLTMAAVNWVLDPILITGAFGFEGFGIAGAAYATIVSWIVSAGVGFAMLQTSEIRLDFSRLSHCKLGRDTGALARVGGPAAFSNSINPVGLSILTAFVASAGQDAVAAFGAGGRVQSFAIVPLLGLSSSIGAIVGQNYGAQKMDRARRAIGWSGGFSIVYGLAVAALIVLFREQIAAVFTDNAQVREELTRFLLISSWGYAGFGVFIIVSGALNAIDRAGLALAQSIARVALVMIPVAYFLRPAWGADAIYASELTANIATGLAAGLLAWWVLREPAGSGAGKMASRAA